MRFWVVALGGVLCGTTGCARRFAQGPPAKNRLRSGHAPTPFSADELRQSCRAGGWRLYRVQIARRPDSYRILRFERATRVGVIVMSAMTDMKGRPFGEQRRVKVLWKGLQSHASFPARATSIRTEKRTTPAGTFECWRYDVTRRVAGRRDHKRFWFAKKLPGPPVELVRRVDGRVVLRMTLVGAGRSEPGGARRPRPRPRAVSRPRPRPRPVPRSRPAPR